ncbi:substrate-binding domain-containing protein [Streptomyces lincolnensis]|uniref:substrate-binding domain-containing protein n=1 Tax=Streptomyces lincolnensis TaxID=1915 RepID=UPI0037CE5911
MVRPSNITSLLLEAFTEAGLSVPGDISVAGHDNTNLRLLRRRRPGSSVQPFG